MQCTCRGGGGGGGGVGERGGGRGVGGGGGERQSGRSVITSMTHRDGEGGGEGVLVPGEEDGPTE